MDEFPISTRLFISMVKEKPILWDRNLENYRSKTATQIAWKEIILAIHPDFHTWEEVKRQDFAKMVIKKWTYIKVTFVKSERKIEQQMMSGDGTKTTKRYIYSKDLQFLKHILLSDTVENNDSDDDEPVNEENNEEGNQAGKVTNKNKIQLESSQTESIKPPAKRTALQKPPIAEKNAKLPKFSTSIPMNRHISFFTSLNPTLDKLDDDQALEFQLGVLKLMKDIKNSKQTIPQETIPHHTVYLPKTDPISDPCTPSISNTHTLKSSPRSYESNESLSDNSVDEKIDFNSF